MARNREKIHKMSTKTYNFFLAIQFLPAILMTQVKQVVFRKDVARTEKLGIEIFVTILDICDT